jgi:hypothetical protein
LDCAISIVDVTAADDGVWTCHAKKNVRDANFVESAFTISVASPYAVSLVSTHSSSLNRRKNKLECLSLEISHSG